MKSNPATNDPRECGGCPGVVFYAADAGCTLYANLTRRAAILRPLDRVCPGPHLCGMILDLSDEQAAALEREPTAIIEGDRCFLSPRIQTLREIRNMIRPEPKREPLPEPKRYEPPRDPSEDGDGAVN